MPPSLVCSEGPWGSRGPAEGVLLSLLPEVLRPLLWHQSLTTLPLAQGWLLQPLDERGTWWPWVSHRLRPLPQFPHLGRGHLQRI